MDYSKVETVSENEVYSKPSGLKPPSQVPKMSSLQSRPLGELHESSMNSRSVMAPPSSNKHKPSGCNIPIPRYGTPDRPLTPSVPEPAPKQRKTLAEQGGEPINRKLVAPATARPVANAGKGSIGRGHAASTSRVPSNKQANRVPAASFANSMGLGARIPSGSTRPKSAFSLHNRSKSHHQGMRPATAMKEREDEDDDDSAERKDFYDHRMESMEREFRMFKDRVETDMRESTNYKEMVQQLQTRVTELKTICAQLETVNKALESDLKDTRSCFSTVKMELEMTQRNHTFETDDLRRKLRNEIDDLESRHEKSTKRIQREKEEAEAQTRNEFDSRIDKLLKEHNEELAGLKKRLEADTEADQSRRKREAQELEANYTIKLRNAAMETDDKRRELQLVQGDLTNTKAELDREKTLRTGLQRQLGDATMQNLTLDAANKAMREKIDFLESDSQAQSQAFNDLHRRMQDAIEAAERAHEKLRQEETLRRKLFNQVQELKGNIRVMCRVRPTHEMEVEPAKISYPDVDTDSKEVSILGPEKQSATGKDITTAYSYSFDRIFGPGSQNGEVFEEISQLVQSALDGYNVCIFCYGQTGSGKTYTMSSPDGMIPRATAQIYAEAQRLEEKGWRYKMEGSFIEVYNETYNDLLGRAEDLDKNKVEVRHDTAKKQTTLENTVSVELDSPDRVEEILKTADKNRTVAATKANMRSSRSHSVFILKLVGTNKITGERSEGTLNLVDLAGSERLEHSKAEGARLKETQNINKSLSCLGDVINALGSSKDGAHVPYRNSKLTYLLQYSLGGNSKTLMFVMVSPLQAHLQETITSLKFATKVHNTHIGTAKKQIKTT